MNPMGPINYYVFYVESKPTSVAEIQFFQYERFIFSSRPHLKY